MSTTRETTPNVRVHRHEYHVYSSTRITTERERTSAFRKVVRLTCGATIASCSLMDSPNDPMILVVAVVMEALVGTTANPGKRIFWRFPH